MGYYMEQIDSEFLILRKNFEACTNALKQLIEKEYRGCYNFKIERVKDIYDAFHKLCWIAEDFGGDDIEEIYFNGEKYCNDDEIMIVIAPYVEDGSYIEMIGEDHTIWRWVFHDGKCDKQYPELSYGTQSTEYEKLTCLRNLGATKIIVTDGENEFEYRDTKSISDFNNECKIIRVEF